MQSHDCGVSSSHREVAGSHIVRTVGGRKGLVSAAGNCYPRTGHAIACRWTIPAGHPLGNACYLVTIIESAILNLPKISIILPVLHDVFGKDQQTQNWVVLRQLFRKTAEYFIFGVLNSQTEETYSLSIVFHM